MELPEAEALPEAPHQQAALETYRRACAVMPAADLAGDLDWLLASLVPGNGSGVPAFWLRQLRAVVLEEMARRPAPERPFE